MNLTVAISVAVVSAIPAFLIVAIILGPRRRRERLRRQTATGSATVVALKPTSTRVGYQPIVNVRMRLRFGESGRVEDIELKIAVQPLDGDRIQIGSVFPLRFEPTQTADFSIDFGGATGAALSDFSG